MLPALHAASCYCGYHLLAVAPPLRVLKLTNVVLELGASLAVAED